MSIKTQDELLQQLQAAVRTGGQGGKTTAAEVRAFLTSLTQQLYERTQAGAEAARPFLFQVNALTEPGHYHLAALTVEQVRQLVQQDVSAVTVLSEARGGHQHEISFGYDHQQATFTVLGIARVGEVTPEQPQDEVATHEVLLIGRAGAAGGGETAGPILRLPYAEVLQRAEGTHPAGQRLVAGQRYQLTDRPNQYLGTAGEVVVTGRNADSLEPEGQLLTTVPDYARYDVWYPNYNPAVGPAGPVEYSPDGLLLDDSIHIENSNPVLHPGQTAALRVVAPTAYGLLETAYQWVTPGLHDVVKLGPDGDDVGAGPYELGFAFPFYGAEYTQFWLSTNGNIGFVNIGAAGGVVPNGNQPKINLFGHDAIVPPGALTYFLTGQAPYRRLVVSAKRSTEYGSESNYDVQAVLYENGTIDINVGRYEDEDLTLMPTNDQPPKIKGQGIQSGTEFLATPLNNRTWAEDKATLPRSFRFTAPLGAPTYAWAASDGSLTSTEASLTVAPARTTTYTCTVRSFSRTITLTTTVAVQSEFVVIYDNTTWTTDSIPALSEQPGTGSAWRILTGPGLNEAGHGISVSDTIEYDLAHDWITERADRYGNLVRLERDYALAHGVATNTAVAHFRWGDPQVAANELRNVLIPEPAPLRWPRPVELVGNTFSRGNLAAATLGVFRNNSFYGDVDLSDPLRNPDLRDRDDTVIAKRLYLYDGELAVPGAEGRKNVFRINEKGEWWANDRLISVSPEGLKRGQLSPELEERFRFLEYFDLPRGGSGFGVGRLNKWKVPNTIGSSNPIQALAFGLNNTSAQFQSVSFGLGNLSSGVLSLAIGHSNSARADNTVALGRSNTVKGPWSVAIGNNHTITQANQVVISTTGYTPPTTETRVCFVEKLYMMEPGAYVAFTSPDRSKVAKLSINNSGQLLLDGVAVGSGAAPAGVASTSPTGAGTGTEVICVASGGATIGATAFNTVPLQQVSLDIKPAGTTGGFDTATSEFVAPVAGTYEVITKARIHDANGAAGQSYGLGAGPDNVDGFWFAWTGILPINGTNRKGLLNVRTLHLNAGQRIRMYMYLDGFAAEVAGEMTVKLLRRD